MSIRIRVSHIAPIAIIFSFGISSVLAAGERNSFDPAQFSTGEFHGCPRDGSGSKRDPYLCELKNRDKPPATARLYTVDQLYRVTPTLPKRKGDRSNWTAAQKDSAARWEQRAVMVEGYLLKAVREREESCNCGSTKWVDHHLWLGASPSSSRARAMVVEVSPRSWPTHPTWSDKHTFDQIVKDKRRVRVAGWLTWDQEHPEQLGKTRRTLWEVHPIHQIQVRSGSQWVNL